MCPHFLEVASSEPWPSNPKTRQENFEAQISTIFQDHWSLKCPIGTEAPLFFHLGAILEGSQRALFLWGEWAWRATSVRRTAKLQAAPPLKCIFWKKKLYMRIGFLWSTYVGKGVYKTRSESFGPSTSTSTPILPSTLPIFTNPLI